MIRTRVLLALSCWALLLPHLATFAQDASHHDEPGAQTVAHGVMAMPFESMVWQSELQRALVSPRAEARPQPGGFVLADTGVLVITDANGKPLQRLAPGESTWIEPGAMRAIVSLEGRSAGYLHISLIPASFVPQEPGPASHGDPFPAPAGLADLDLLRGILERGEELVVTSGNAPGFLQVTSGTVYVTAESGEVTEVAAGSPHQFHGEITLGGASRAPASLVIARLGPRIPARLVLFDPSATPLSAPLATPLATPISLEAPAALSVDAWLCPPGFDETAPLISCTEPAVGVRFTAEGEGKPVSILADVAGNAMFPTLTSGALTLRANLPEGATTAVASCRDLHGDALGRVRNSALSLSLEPGAKVACSWFIASGDAWPAGTLSLAVLACPPGMTEEALHPEFCLPTPADVALQLAVEDAVLEPAQGGEGMWVWGPLLERSYELTLVDLPAGFSRAVLDDGMIGGEGDPFQIDLGEDLAPVRTLYLLQPLSATAAELDSDTDRLTDAQEVELGTDPYLADSDSDGLMDDDETEFYNTDPLLADTDDDGLNDQEEVAIFFTNPFLADTDGDGTGDADEVAVQTDPLDMLSLPPTPTWEPTATPALTPTPSPTTQASPVIPFGTPAGSSVATPVSTPTSVPAVLPTLSPGTTPISHREPLADTPVSPSAAPGSALDDDGLATVEEVAIYGTDPFEADTDGDGMNDGDEVASGRDPLDSGS